MMLRLRAQGRSLPPARQSILFTLKRDRLSILWLERIPIDQMIPFDRNALQRRSLQMNP